jgi:hypothetical protein
MEFTYRTVTQDDQGNPLPTDPCHIRWETDEQSYSGIIAIPVEVFAGATQEEKIALVENEIRNIIQAKIDAQSFIFNGSATV